MNRGLTVVSSLRSMKKRDLTEEELLQAEVLGWCVELVPPSINHLLLIFNLIAFHVIVI